MTAKTAKYCVYASHSEDAIGRTYAHGDGVTASIARIYAICDTKEQAERELERLNKSFHLTRSRMPGDGRLYPELEVAEFDPLDFVGDQHRDDYHGKRLAALVASLHEKAKANAASLSK